MDVRRVAVMAILLGGLVWAFMTSPLTKGLRGGGGATFRPAAPGAFVTQPGQPAAAQPTASARSAPATPIPPEEIRQWRDRYATAWQRDPFFTAPEEQALAAPKGEKKTAAPPTPLPSYTVKAILISGAGKVATLNGQLVSEGEPIGEERVVEIRPDAVILERAGQRRRISLPGGTTPIGETSSRQTGGTARP